MPKMQICLVLVLVCALFSTAAAQEIPTAKTTLTITANATGERVRITAPASIVQMHVEVYAAGGEKLFDQEIRGGNVFDWHLQDGQAQRLAPGAYICVVTAKSVSGKLTQKIGAVTVAEKSASVQAGSPQLSLQQTQAIGPVEADSSWTIAGENEPQTPTVIANDGRDGQMIRGRGALTFRVGNFFSGVDTEQMRLTETGDLGIGTSRPQSKLDVVGTIRAERFLVVKPSLGNGDKTSAATQATDAVDGVQPLVAGTGTQNQIAKWTDNAGTLGDSVITETPAGRVGVGIVSPLSKFHVSSSFDGLRLTSTNDTTPVWAQFNTSLGSGLGYFGVEGNTAGTFLPGTLPYATALSSGGSGTALQLGSAGSVKMTILSGGNVGIGNIAPGAKLDVAGNINTSTQYNIGGERVLSVGDDNVVVGVDAGKTNTGGGNAFFGAEAGRNNTSACCNSFFGVRAGHQNTGLNQSENSFFGHQSGRDNVGGRANSFFGGSAGILNTTGSSNTFVGIGAGGDNTTGGHNTIVGSRADVGSNNLDYATAIGSDSEVNSSDTIALGRSNGSDTVLVYGKLQIDTLAAAGNTELCLNGSNRVGPCSASSLRYKKAVLPFAAGLSIINRLQPIAFTWKDDGLRDLGLAAEDVALVEPRLTFKNKDGEIEGVKYNRVNLVLINAVKEQQQQIATLQTRLRRLEQTLKHRSEAKRRHR